MDLEPGDEFAGLRIEGVAGRGGMGVVYRAIQPELDRVVALKTIAPALAADPAFSARFVRESKAAAAVEHPNVLPIFSAGEERGVLYIVMRYVDGPDLRSLVRAHDHLEPARAAAIVAQIADALDAAHARGLVHRDVKPANVLLDEHDHAYLTDFGLTKRVHSSATAATRAGGWVGTLGYVAPEQIRDEHVDGRADVYALGCVLFHLITGAPPFARSTDEATLWAHLHEEPPPLPAGLAPALEAVIHRALAKAPDDRFATAGDFGRAVRAATGAGAAAAEQTTVAPPAPRAGRTAAGRGGETAADEDATVATRHVRAAGRRPALVSAAVAALVAGAAAAVIALASSGGGGAGDDAAATTDGAAPSSPASVAVGERPNGLAVARGRAYVTLPRSDRLGVVDLEAFDGVRPGPVVGRGTLDIDAGFGALWVTTLHDGVERLTRIDLDSGRRSAAPLPDGVPVAVESGRNAVWVGLRGGREGGYPPARVSRIDPDTGRVVKSVEIPYGVQDMAVGPDAVWVSNRDRARVTRLDIETGRLHDLRVGRGPAGLDVGPDALWVANSAENTLSRVSLETGRRVATIGVAGQPRFIVHGEDSVWTTTFASSTLVRVDPETNRQSGSAVELGVNPTKLVVSDGAVYVVSQAEGLLQRVVVP